MIGTALSVREAEVITLVSRGLTAPQVAAQLHISPHSVKTVLRRVYRKVGVLNAPHAIGELSRRRLLAGTLGPVQRDSIAGGSLVVEPIGGRRGNDDISTTLVARLLTKGAGSILLTERERRALIRALGGTA